MFPFAALALAVSISTDPRSPDPVEGRWLGEIGYPIDRTVYGIEFKKNAAGKLAAFLYHPAIHFYGLELPGEVKVDGNRSTSRARGSRSRSTRASSTGRTATSRSR
jgi:hypothetical protein